MSGTKRLPTPVLSSSKIAGSAYSYYSRTIENTQGTEHRTASKMRRLFASALLSTASAVVMASLAGSPARAGACVPLTPQNGDTVTCAGSFDSTLYFSGVEDLTVVLQAGATVQPFADTEGIVVEAFDENYGNGTVKNYGLIITGDPEGEDADGIVVSTKYDATVFNGATGFVTTYGYDADGIIAESYEGDASVTNAGTVGTYGEWSFGLVAVAESGYAYAGNSGTVSTEDDGSDAVYAWGRSGATANNTGQISTDGEESYALVAGSESGYSYATNSGDIETFGDWSVGIYSASEGGYAYAANDADGTVTTHGYGADAIVAETEEGDAYARNAGTVITAGEEAYGVLADAEDGYAKAANSGSVETYGEDAAGLYAYTDGGDATAANQEGGSVTTHGDDADAVLAQSNEGYAIASNAGTVITYGSNAYGVVALSEDDDATASNSGIVTVYGGQSVGLYASGEGGDATAANDEGGAVTTHGYNGDAIWAWSDYDNAAVSNAGDVVAYGDNASGIVAVAPYGHATAKNYGSISLYGETEGISFEDAVAGLTGAVPEDYVDDLVVGMIAVGGDGASVRNYEGGTIYTDGKDAAGMLAVSTSPEYAAATRNDGTIETGQGGGYHDLAFGMAAIGGEGGSYVNNTGDIQTSGLGSFGALAASDGNAVAYNSGTITAGSAATSEYDMGAFGIAAASASGTALVVNGGDIETYGVAGLGAVAIAGGTSSGLEAASIPPWALVYYFSEIVADYGTARVVNDTDATIVTHGDAGIGATAVGFVASVENRGAIETDGLASMGMLSLGMYAGAYNAEGATITTGAAEGDGIAAIGMLAGGLYVAGVENNGTIATYDTGGVGAAALAGKYAIARNGYDGSIGTEGNYSAGLVAASLFTAFAINDGEIATSGDLSMGILSVGSAYAALEELDSGLLGGLGSYIGSLAPMSLYSPGPGYFGGAIAVNDYDGVIETDGDMSLGVMALSFNREAIAANDGSVTTHGEYAIGVGAFSVGGDARAYNDGTIETSGDLAAGLMASGGAQPVWSLEYATGIDQYDLQTYFPDLDTRAMEGDVLAYNGESGFISTTGYYATGIAAWTSNGRATAVNYGTVSTGTNPAATTPSEGSGVNAPGMWAASYGDDVLSTAYALNAGTVTTWGEAAAGVVANTYQENSVDITDTGWMDTVSDGAIIVASVVNTGDIETHGDNSDGVSANVQGVVKYYSTDEYDFVYLDAGASVANAGSIVTYGDYANGVSARGPHVEVVNAADAAITVNGNYSVGIDARSYGLLTTEVTNNGTITVNGDSSAGIYASGDFVTITNSATGVIDASDSYAGVIPDDDYGLGILVNESYSITIDNAGTIYGTVAVGYSLGIHLTAHSLNNTDLTNTGTIEGNVILSSGEDTVTNDGGTISGGLFVGDGDNDVTIQGTGNDIGYGIHSAAYTYSYSTLAFDQTDTMTFDNGTDHGISPGSVGFSPAGANGIAISGFDRIDFNDGTTVFDETDILTNKYDGDIFIHEGAKVSALGDMWIAAGTVQIGSESEDTVYADLELTQGATIHSNADLYFNDGGRLIVSITGDDGTGFIETSGSLDVEGPTIDGDTVLTRGFTVYANVLAGIDLTVGNEIDIVYAAGGVNLSGDAAPTVVDNSILFNFTSGASENDFYLTVGRDQTINDVVDEGGNGTPNTDSIASALEGYLANVPQDNPIVVYLSGNWPNDPEAQAAALRKLVQETVPDEAALSGQSLMAATDAVLDLIMDRLSGGGFLVASNGSGESGVSAGDMDLGGDGKWALWGRAGKNWAEFTPSGANGFDSDSWGVSVGIDGEVASNLRVGASYFYTKANFDENGAGANSTADIDGNGVVVYTTYRPEPWYLNASLGYGWNSYDSKRRVTGFGTNTASYDGTQFIGRAELGYIFKEGALDITPHVGIRVNVLDIDSYTETGPAPAVTVNSRSVSSVRGVLGLGLRYTADLGDGDKIIPEGFVRLLNEFGNPDEGITGNIVNGGAFNTQTVARDDLSYGLGAGLTYEMNDTVSVRVLYNGEFQDDYDEHSVSAAFRLAF